MCGSISNPGMGAYPPHVRYNSTSRSQSAISQWGWGFPHRAERYRPGDHRLRPRFIGVVQVWKGLWPGDGTLFPQDAAGSTNPSQSAISQWDWGFLHLARRYRPDEPPCSFPVCWTCRCVEGFRTLGWGLILPGWRWLHDLQSTSDQPVGLGVSTPCGPVSTRGTTVFVTGFVGVVEAWKDL